MNRVSLWNRFHHCYKVYNCQSCDWAVIIVDIAINGTVTTTFMTTIIATVIIIILIMMRSDVAIIYIKTNFFNH